MIVEKEISYPHDDLIDLFTGKKLKAVYRDDGNRPSYSFPEATSLLVPMPKDKLLRLMSTRDGIENKANNTEKFICPYSGAMLKVIDLGGGNAIATGGMNLRDRIEDPFTFLYRARMRKGVPAEGTLPKAPVISAAVVTPPPRVLKAKPVSDTAKEEAEKFLKPFDKRTRVSVAVRKGK